MRRLIVGTVALALVFVGRPALADPDFGGFTTDVVPAVGGIGYTMTYAGVVLDDDIVPIETTCTADFNPDTAQVPVAVIIEYCNFIDADGVINDAPAPLTTPGVVGTTAFVHNVPRGDGELCMKARVLLFIGDPVLRDELCLPVDMP